jgi:hypothetical protein
MKRILSPFVIVVLLCVKNDVQAQNSYSAVSTATEQHPATTVVSSSVTNFSGTVKSDRVLLNWTIGKNAVPDRFEVERSQDGKNFVTAALVFGDDEQDKPEYQFYEKVKKVRSFYRLKIFNKDNTVDYSTIISP